MHKILLDFKLYPRTIFLNLRLFDSTEKKGSNKEKETPICDQIES